MASNDVPSIRDIAQTLEAWAPPGSAQSYDNVGLQVGDASRSVERAIVALDCTPEVVEEAKNKNATLILTHHPLLFQPLKQITADDYESHLALRLAESGIALYSIHTNLDAAPGGVSFALAERLGLSDISFLDGMDEALYKLAVFVPSDHFEAVHQAMADAGAGEIGDYEACAFTTEGTGYFKPGEGANPFIGKAGGELESADEVKLEMEVARWELGRVLGALDEAHPYEEVAYDVYPVDQKYQQAGLGAVGELADPMPLDDFLARVADRLGAGSLRYAGDPSAPVERVAVCGGAGSDFVGKALSAGADAYVTSDVKYHDFFQVLNTGGQPQMAFIDAGHYETEALTEQLLCNYLDERFPQVDWQRTEARTSPMRTFAP